MISRGQSTCPSVDELSGLLETHTAITHELDQHLGHCVNCRETLSYLAGDATWWDEASSVLSKPAMERDWSVAICALSKADPRGKGDAQLCEHELRQLQSMLEPASHPELIGRIGRYELEQLIGRGGMGLVFRARDTELHRVVAVKTLAVHLIPIGAARSRFVREARATASLTHPHIVPVYDVITEGAVPAIVMQYIAGPTLEQQLFENGPLPWQDVLRVGVQLADALAIAHGGDLIHRDIKPGNVLLDAGGSRALLTDFGLVRALDDATLTRSGVLAGTPDYMSPEQAKGDVLTHSSDLFSLGSLLYAMLTGHPPFRAENPMAVMNRICHQKARPLREFRSDIPIELTQLVDRLLAKAPRKRFESAEQLADRLRHLAGSQTRLRRPWNYASLVIAAGIACAAIVLFALSPWPLSNSVDRAPANQANAPEEDSANLSSEARVLIPDHSLAELALIDERIERLRTDASRLLNDSSAPSERLNQESPAFDVLDSALDDLNADLRRLESDSMFQQSFGSP